MCRSVGEEINKLHEDPVHVAEKLRDEVFS